MSAKKTDVKKRKKETELLPNAIVQAVTRELKTFKTEDHPIKMIMRQDSGIYFEHEESKTLLSITERQLATGAMGWRYLKWKNHEVVIYGTGLAVFTNEKMKNCFDTLMRDIRAKIKLFRTAAQVAQSMPVGQTGQ